MSSLGSRPLRVVTGLIALMSLGCGGANPTNPSAGAGTPPVPLSGVAAASDRVTSTPEAEGFNASLLAELNGRLRVGADGAIDSLLIARRGKLVAEEYYQGMAAETVHTVQSVTKSVASLLAGIAIEIRESTAAHRMAVRSFGSHLADYGYLWWRLRDPDVIAAIGAQGQFIFISPTTGVVAVLTGRQSANEMRAIDLFYTYILAAAR